MGQVCVERSDGTGTELQSCEAGLQVHFQASACMLVGLMMQEVRTALRGVWLLRGVSEG